MFQDLVIEFAGFSVKFRFLYCITQWGALILRAEIIPTEPDPGNAGAGMANRNHLPHWLFF
jgi:hypothetical protein